MSESPINLPISQFAYDVLMDVAQARSTTPVALVEEIAEKLHNIPSQRASETEFLYALGFTDEEIAASQERIKHLLPQP